MTWVGWAICSLASFILLIAALGVIRLPDALARQHAATKAGALAVSLFTTGLVLLAWDAGWGWAWLWRLLAIVTILLLTLPLASHGLARAGVMERERLGDTVPPRAPNPPQRLMR